MSWSHVRNPMKNAKNGQITSRFDGVITKLHYEADDIAKVGKVQFPREK